ncbi:GyrI-like domain-containing protein [uncultured Draconibacterium sp.]|uniref:GyrI-like domain-containing protein n=1 Tax=uncultured Draconibacterium sp. TaxID=1573823 RepID=UPI003216366A
MQVRIEQIKAKKLLGIKLQMSLANNRTAELWRNFMQRRKEIINPLSGDLFSLQIYPSGYFTEFSPALEFEKWALIEVEEFSAVHDDMESFILPGGEYAVFHYKGPANDPSVFHYIFTTWLPQSAYLLDRRPHFEILGEKYKNNDPESEEEIWIPIAKK